MIKEKYILFTSGRGPVECALAVHGIQKVFRKYLDTQQIKYSIINQNIGAVKNSMDTIVFGINVQNMDKIDTWLGTLQWICKSPIRKYHKRKNWYIKCQEISLPSKVELSLGDVLMQTYKASGPGGQHRNKVETAIRLIHQPTGITVTASEARSQLQNKKKAIEKLKIKLDKQNECLLSEANMDKWSSQLEIERGAPVGSFVGLKFK